MSRVYFIKAAVTALIRIQRATLEQNMAASPGVVGRELARQISEHVQREKLGYYPALDYFAENDAIDRDLIDTAHGIAWVVTELVRSELRARLRPAFSHVDIEDIQMHAFTMPGIRPHRPNALRDLARHYTPDMVKVTLFITSIERQASVKDFEKMAEAKLLRWLEPHFDEVKITSARIVDG